MRHLLRAFVRVRERHPRAQLVLAAAEVDVDAVNQFLCEFGVTQCVRVLREPKDIASLLRTFEVFALPLHEDAVPVSLLEAMAAGVPVVAAAAPSLREVIPRDLQEYLVREGDTEMLAASIASLVADPEKRRKEGHKAQAYAQDTFGRTLLAGRSVYGYREGPSPWLGRRGLKRLLYACLPKHRLVSRGSASRAQFALTFDDAPDPIYTPQILDILKEYGVAATFFVVGNRVEEYPSLTQRIVDEGHELANHSYTHRRLESCSIQSATREVRRTNEILNELQGKRCSLFRPPFGRISRQCVSAAWTENCTIVMWSVDPKDYCATAPCEIVEKVAARPIMNGDIILYHGTNETALAALPEVIRAARSSGRAGVLISDMLSSAS
jgi:peptidoglycan/xylan/chitin deacetylase (PgdA/CDA1 family)